MASRRAGERMDQHQKPLTLSEADQGIFGTVRDITLAEITIDPTIQVRVDGLDEARVEQYVELLLTGNGFKTPIVLFQDGADLLLAAGFHRCEAYKLAQKRFEPTVLAPQLPALRAEIRQGGRAAAIEFAEDDNLAHGLELRLKDKRHLLERRWKRGHAWQRLSNRAIAAKLGVNRETVAAWRAELEQVAGFQPPERVGKDGKTYDVTGVQASNQRRAEERQAAEPPTPDPLDAKKREIASAVTEVLRAAQRPMTYREIEFAVNASLGRVVNAGLLSGVRVEMTRDGRLRNVGGGRYALPESALSGNGYQIADAGASDNRYQIEPEPEAWLDTPASKGQAGSDDQALSRQFRVFLTEADRLLNALKTERAAGRTAALDSDLAGWAAEAHDVINGWADARGEWRSGLREMLEDYLGWEKEIEA